MGENEKSYSYYDRLGNPDSNGPLEGGACVWLVKQERDKTYILFQKRAEGITNGGYYDASAGGHINEFEEPLAAAIRETKEEIGLDIHPEELRFVCTYTTDRKIISVYISDRTDREDELTLNHDEVETVEWVSLDEFDLFVRARVKPPLRELVPHLPVLRYYIENYL